MAQRKINSDKISFYKLKALGIEDEDTDNPEAPLQVDEEFIVKGKIEDHVIVSVSPNMSQRSANELVVKLGETIKKPTIIVTHNIQFLRAQKISAKDAMKISKRMEGGIGDTDNTKKATDIMGREPAKIYSDGN